MKSYEREERRMKISVLLRWVGPAAIAGGVFMVFSALSGLPITIPYLSQSSPTGYDAVGSGLILFALVLLLVGMLGLYAKKPEPTGARVIEYGQPTDLAQPVEARPVPEEARYQQAEEMGETVAPRASRSGALVVGAGLLLFFLLRD
jgi:hypothetical protein